MVFFVDSNINLMWKWYRRVKISNFLVLGVMGPFWVPVTPSTRKFEILTLPYHFHIKFMLESTKKGISYGRCYWFSKLLFGRFWHSSNFWMTISRHLQMIEGWFWYQTSSFGMNFLKKYMKFFFGFKKAIFWPKGGNFGYP